MQHRINRCTRCLQGIVNQCQRAEGRYGFNQPRQTPGCLRRQHGLIAGSNSRQQGGINALAEFNGDSSVTHIEQTIIHDASESRGCTRRLIIAAGQGAQHACQITQAGIFVGITGKAWQQAIFPHIAIAQAGLQPRRRG